MSMASVSANGRTGEDAGAATRVLVADDDATTLVYLDASLRALGCVVTVTDDRDEAIALTLRQSFDLVLLDCRMPRGGAESILQALAHEPANACANSLFIATTADVNEPTRAHLRKAGFVDVLAKPCTAEGLRALINRVGRGAALLLDDGEAMAATGDGSIVRSLRLLLREELEQLHGDMHDLARDPARFGDRLHRLRSACGFCGAVRLQREVIAMQRRLRAGKLADGDELAGFMRSLTATMAALQREGNAIA
jgi:two-component system OmpR family response regulator